MITRILFAIKHSIGQRQSIAKTAIRLKSCCEITPALLNAQGIRGLVLDFDGVLSTHGNPRPLPDVEQWLTDLQRAQIPMAILSNKPTAERREYFLEKFPDIHFVSAVRKKPYPDGLESIAATWQLPINTITLVDDRLLTGGLACQLAGCPFIWITQPLNGTHPIEHWFKLLRTIEKFGLK